MASEEDEQAVHVDERFLWFVALGTTVVITAEWTGINSGKFELMARHWRRGNVARLISLLFWGFLKVFLPDPKAK